MLTVKAIDESTRTITGVATTPSPDRMGDIVEPLGAKFANPLPLLWQHQHDKPVGTVVFDSPTSDGINFTATMPTDAELQGSGDLFDRVREAWKSVVLKMVRGVSIGFRAIEYSFLDNGGIRYSEYEIYELSLVTVPANADATIESIKSIDRQHLAALGTKAAPVANSGGVSPTKTVKIQKKDFTMKKSYSEQIADFQATREKKVKELDGIMAKSVETGETLDAEQSEAYDTLQSEIETIDKHIERLQQMEALQAKSAKPVDHSAAAKQVAKPECHGITAVKKHKPVEKGIRLARVIRCFGQAKGELSLAASIAKRMYGDDEIVQGVVKAAVEAGSTNPLNWAGALVGEETSVYADFVEFLRPQTIVGRFGTDGVPALRSVPFRTPLVSQVSGGDGYWVGEGAAKPLTKFGFSRTTLDPLKVANIAVLTEELLRDSSPSADALVRQSLVDALRERLDLTFIDPAITAISGVRPASITNGVSGTPSAGNDGAAIRSDVKALMQTFIAANNAPTSGVWVMSAATALALSMVMNPLGQQEFPGISMNGGTFFGMPVIVSEYVPTDSTGSIVVLINASDIYLGDEGGFAVDVSREASLQMADNASHNSTTPTAAELVSMFQTNSVAFRAERTINWAKRRASSVAVLTGVNWGAEGS